MKLNDFKLLNNVFKSENVKFKEKIGNYNIADNEITGGRAIINIKKNQLFTGRFEKKDILDLTSIWKSYKNDKIYQLQSNLLHATEKIAKNYRLEVSPLEVILYTSNYITSSFSNIRLLEEIGRTISIICSKYPVFIKSLDHILNVWQWPHVINISMIALGYICSEPDVNAEQIKLLKSSFNYHRFDSKFTLGCFLSLLYSKKEEFIPDILSIIHDLKGYDHDKIIGNIFRTQFLTHFPQYYDDLDESIFWDSSLYVRKLIKNIISNNLNTYSLVNRYKNASNQIEKDKIIQEGFYILTSASRGGYNDATNMLITASSQDISKRMLKLLNLNATRKVPTKFIIKYFSYVKFQDVLSVMVNLPESNNFYAACRVALFKQNVISAENFISDFLLETRIFQIEDYIDGFYGFSTELISDLKTYIFNFFENIGEISEHPQAINNYEKLINKYRQFYDIQIGRLLQSYFGYKTILGEIQLKIPEQKSCLKIFEVIVNSSNYKKYEDFLYYVAVTNSEFSSSIRDYAKEILRNIDNYQIKI